MASGQVSLGTAYMELAADQLAGEQQEAALAAPAIRKTAEGSPEVLLEVDRYAAVIRDDASRAGDAMLRTRAARAGAPMGGRPPAYIEQMKDAAAAPAFGLTDTDVDQALEQCSDYNGVIVDGTVTTWYRPGIDWGPGPFGALSDTVLAASRVQRAMEYGLDAGSAPNVVAVPGRTEGHEELLALTAPASEVAALVSLYGGEIPLASRPHDGHGHWHEHSENDELHGEPLNEVGEHWHEHGHNGKHGLAHTTENMQEAGSAPGTTIWKVPGELNAGEYEVPDYGGPYGAQGEVQRYADMASRAGIATTSNVHGGLNKTVTTRTGAHASSDEDAAERDTRQPARGGRGHPDAVAQLANEVQAVIDRANSRELFRTDGTRRGCTSPPGAPGQRERGLARR